MPNVLELVKSTELCYYNNIKIIDHFNYYQNNIRYTEECIKIG